MPFGQARFSGRIVRIPAWAMVLGAMAALALMAVLAVVAAGVALVAIPLALGGAFIARKFGGFRTPSRTMDADRFDPARRRRAEAVVIETTWEDVTDKPRNPER